MTTTPPRGIPLIAVGPEAPAWYYSQEISRLSQELSPIMRPVFRSWLKEQSRGVLVKCTRDEIFLWLASLHPRQTEAEYRLMFMEISWLETLTCDFYRFLSEESL